MSATDEFRALVEGPAQTVPLDVACLLVAAHGHAREDAGGVVAAGLTELDALAAACPDATVTALREHLFVTLGFTGDRLGYAHERNSYLDQVMALRRGIPITLAVVTIEVGRRLGLHLAPVGMPGHFLVGLGDGTYLDAFEHGRVLDRAACQERFRDLAGPQAPWSDAFLAPVGPLTVVTRVLANLRRRFAEQRNLTNLDWVLELRAVLPGMPITERAERSSILAALGRYDEAARELERLAALQDPAGARVHPSGGPATGDPAAAEELRRQAARLRARLN